MKPMLWGFPVLALALTGWQMSSGTGAGVDPITSSSIARDGLHDFTIANLDAKTACTATRGAAVTRRSHSFAAGMDCGAVMPALASVRTWTDNDDGSVALTDESGNEVLTLSSGEGVDYQTLDPDNAFLTLTEVP